MPPATTAIDGGSIVTATFQLYHDDVKLGLSKSSPTTILTGTAVTFDKTLNGASVLTINANETTFRGTVGDASPLLGLVTDPAGTTHIDGGLVHTNGNQMFGDDATLGANTQLIGVDITFKKTLVGESSTLAVDSSGVAISSVKSGSSRSSRTAPDPPSSTATSSRPATWTSAMT